VVLLSLVLLWRVVLPGGAAPDSFEIVSRRVVAAVAGNRAACTDLFCVGARTSISLPRVRHRGVDIDATAVLPGGDRPQGEFTNPSLLQGSATFRKSNQSAGDRHSRRPYATVQSGLATPTAAVHLY
jgi:hypothetical protein